MLYACYYNVIYVVFAIIIIICPSGSVHSFNSLYHSTSHPVMVYVVFNIAALIVVSVFVVMSIATKMEIKSFA